MNVARVVNNREIRYTLTEYLHFIKSNAQVCRWLAGEVTRRVYLAHVYVAAISQSSDYLRTEQRQYDSPVKPFTLGQMPLV